MPSRTWGPWTEHKLDVLEDYLKAFTRACSGRASRTLYLDLFAGSGDNVSRDDGHPIANSAMRALRCEPPFTKLAFFELDRLAADDLRSRLTEQFPGRDFDVIPGDSNATAVTYLKDLATQSLGWRHTPAFAFVDQYTAEVKWSILEQLAGYRLPNRDGTVRKVELFLLFADSFIPRGAGIERDLSEDFLNRVDELFGTEIWREIREGRRRKLLSADEARKEMVNLMRYRLENHLGYTITRPLRLRSDRGSELYTMIYASNHDVGGKIMSHLYKGSEQAQANYRHKATMKRKLDRVREQEATTGAEGMFPIEQEWVAKPPTAGPLDPMGPPVLPWRLPESSGD